MRKKVTIYIKEVLEKIEAISKEIFKRKKKCFSKNEKKIVKFFKKHFFQ